MQKWNEIIHLIHQLEDIKTNKGNFEEKFKMLVENIQQKSEVS